ncbi:hypothetical protein N7540_012062 [Penicillium herquei]|nr:hypothetical protein N7540_012062 [Penicillium herquei]
MLDRSSLISPMLLDHNPEKELDTEQSFRRDGQLRRCYERACEFPVQLWVIDDSVIRFDENINEIGPYTELKYPDRDTASYKRWWRSGHDGYDSPVDYSSGGLYEGRETAVIFWPTIWGITCKHLTVPPLKSVFDGFAGRSELECEGLEWTYVDDRDWVYAVISPGRVYLAGEGLVKPDDVPRK